MSFLPQNSFYRTPRYSGGMNVPGAPGNIQTLPYFGELLKSNTNALLSRARLWRRTTACTRS